MAEKSFWMNTATRKITLDDPSQVAFPKGSAGLTNLCYGHADQHHLAGDVVGWKIAKAKANAVAYAALDRMKPTKDTLPPEVWNKKLNRILLNDRSDTTQLLGCFEQTSQDLAQLQSELVKSSIDQLPGPVISLEHRLGLSQDLAEQMQLMEAFLEQNWNRLPEDREQLLRKLQLFKRSISKGQSRFEWVDSVLVNAIEHGEWAIFENANLCNPSILDRLNSLLEEGNHSLSINEQGLVAGDALREAKAHEDFRPIFLMSKKTLVD
jgi:hypothetical protein